MAQSIYNQKAYPPEALAAIKAMPPLATAIANRWLLGWPEAVKALLASGEYVEALTRQEQAEREALAEPGMMHLSQWEKTEAMGLTQAPPAATTTT